MKRLIALAVLVMANAVACQSVVCATIYNIEPYDIPGAGDNYEISGGFIQTNGRLGNLTRTDILSYEVIVSGGLNPFTFRSEDNSLSFGPEFLATPTQLIIPVPTDDIPNLVLFEASQGEPFTALAYFVNTPESTPGFGTWIQYTSPVNKQILEVLSETPVPLLVASVPEPSGLVLVVCTVLVGAGVGRHRKSKA